MDPTDHDTAVPVSDELDLTTDAVDGLAGAYEVERLLAGRFFTIGGAGTVSAWSRAAQAAFGFTDGSIVGDGFVAKLMAPAEREKRAAEIDALLKGDGPPVAVHIETSAVNADGVEFDERFAIVPIRLHDGYALNGLLQDIGKHSRAEDADRIRRSHVAVLGLVQSELAGVVEPAEEGDEETGHLVGALVIFDGSSAPAARYRDADSEDASDEEQLESAMREVDELRTSLEDAARGVEEAQHDAELAREEVEQTRAKLNELRGSADDEHDR
ncbi:MAG: PAS domain S-box protein, partial [Thermoleophilaceae bacterium]